MFTMFWDFSKANLRWWYRPKITPQQHAQWGWLDQHHLYRHIGVSKTPQRQETQQRKIILLEKCTEVIPLWVTTHGLSLQSQPITILLWFPQRPAGGALLNTSHSPPRIPLRDCWRKSLDLRITYRWAQGWALHSRGPGSVAELVSS